MKGCESRLELRAITALQSVSDRHTVLGGLLRPAPPEPRGCPLVAGYFQLHEERDQKSAECVEQRLVGRTGESDNKIRYGRRDVFDGRAMRRRLGAFPYSGNIR